MEALRCAYDSEPEEPGQARERGQAFRQYLAVPVLTPAAVRQPLLALLTHLRGLPGLSGLAPVEDPWSPAFVPARLVQPEYHVSLSRVLEAGNERFEALRRALAEAVAGHSCYRATCRGCVVLPNDAGTRAFLCLPLVGGLAQTLSLIASVDAVLLDFRLPRYYQPPLPHLSVAALPGEQAQELLSQAALQTRQLPEWSFEVKNVELFSGKRRYLLWLHK